MLWILARRVYAYFSGPLGTFY